MRFCELREKEVINICTGKRLGFVVDFDINLATHCIESIIIPGPGKLCCLFGHSSEYIIPLDCIRKIGDDLVIVEICEEHYLFDR